MIWRYQLVVSIIQNFEIIKKRSTCYKAAYKNFHKKFQSNLFVYGCLMVKNRQTWWHHFFETQFFAFLIVLRKNKWHIFISETKLNNIEIFWITILKFDLIWPDFDFSSGQIENECHHRILRPKWQKNMCRATLTQHFHLKSIVDLALTLTFT